MKNSPFLATDIPHGSLDNVSASAREMFLLVPHTYLCLGLSLFRSCCGLEDWIKLMNRDLYKLGHYPIARLRVRSALL